MLPDSEPALEFLEPTWKIIIAWLYIYIYISLWKRCRGSCALPIACAGDVAQATLSGICICLAKDQRCEQTPVEKLRKGGKMNMALSAVRSSVVCRSAAIPCGLASVKSHSAAFLPRFSGNLRRGCDLSRQSKSFPAALSIAVKTVNTGVLANIEPERIKLKIGIVGFGNFGQFLAKAMIKQGHSVVATSRSDYADLCHRMRIKFFRDPNGFCDEYPDVIVICTPVLSTESALRAFPLQRLKRKILFVDVLSVKEFPRNLFLQVLPPECEILCTHPMFGSEIGKESWAGLPFVFDKVRVSQEGCGAETCRAFLKIFEAEGCRMVEMSCAEHDRQAARSQFITHTVGRILSHLDLRPTPINTNGYDALMRLKENTVRDSFDVYFGLFMYNFNAAEQIENLDQAFESVKRNLHGRFHILRKQLVETIGGPAEPISILTNERTGSSQYMPSSQNFMNPSSFISTARAVSSCSSAINGGDSDSDSDSDSNSNSKHMVGRGDESEEPSRFEATR